MYSKIAKLLGVIIIFMQLAGCGEVSEQSVDSSVNTDAETTESLSTLLGFPKEDNRKLQ